MYFSQRKSFRTLPQSHFEPFRTDIILKLRFLSGKTLAVEHSQYYQLMNAIANNEYQKIISEIDLQRLAKSRSVLKAKVDQENFRNLSSF